MKKAFTLSEVLITITIVGVIAAFVIPPLKQASEFKQYKAGFVKAMNYMNDSSMLFEVEKGFPAQCGYWKDPVAMRGASTATCDEYNEYGACTHWSNVGTDYNGTFRDCPKLYDFMKTRSSIMKVCETDSKANGCIPGYHGYDTLELGYNTVRNNYSGCTGWSEANIRNGKAFVTEDGMIFFPYGGRINQSVLLMAVDVNGQKGPNLWGYDILVLKPFVDNYETTPQWKASASCAFVEAGGINAVQLMKKY